VLGADGLVLIENGIVLIQGELVFFQRISPGSIGVFHLLDLLHHAFVILNELAVFCNKLLMHHLEAVVPAN